MRCGKDLGCIAMDSDVRNDPQVLRQALSSMLDGDAVDVDLACRAWGEDPRSRADWHVYHLIGEVMRSDDARTAPQHDARFLRRLHERLAAEPVVLAPAAASRHEHATRVRRGWAAPFAVAAGFIAVAGVVVVSGVAVPGDVTQDSSARVSGTVISGGTLSAQAGSAAASAAPTPGDGVLIRSVELDRYLAAHKQYSSSSVLAVPGGAVRNAAATAPGR